MESVRPRAPGLVLVLAAAVAIGALLAGPVAPLSVVPGNSPSSESQVTSSGPATLQPDASSGAPTTGGPASVAPSSPAAKPAVLVGAGDIGECNGGGDRRTAALLSRIEGTVFAVGDLAYPTGTVQEFRDCYAPSWGKFKARTRPAPGNHDWMTKGLAGYRAYWGNAALNAHGDPWYSFDIGTWHAIVLDSNCDETGGCGAGSTQNAWLENDLDATRARCTIALFHHPLFTSNPAPGDPDVYPLWETLFGAGVDVIVNGHYHDYERFAPQTPTGAADPVKGIREFVVGTGGGPLRSFGEHVEENSEVRIDGTYGVLELTLGAAGYDWRFIAVDGTTRDHGSGDCH